MVTLTYLRRNRVQAEIGETFGVSQSTISRAITAITPLLDKALRLFVPTADELDETTRYVVDGTLLPCWSGASHPHLYAGKHKTTGMNVHVAATLGGRLAWVSDPIDGSRHDNHCLAEAAVLTGMDAGHWIGDTGDVGNNMITPIKKPPHRDLLDWEKEFNTQVNKIRWIIEQVIARLKTWRILHTDYRRPIDTFPTTISAVIALDFFHVNCAVTLANLCAFRTGSRQPVGTPAGRDHEPGRPVNHTADPQPGDGPWRSPHAVPVARSRSGWSVHCVLRRCPC
jgi:hypothetical protein